MTIFSAGIIQLGEPCQLPRLLFIGVYKQVSFIISIATVLFEELG
jgi:hypothetical protein